ncbi:uncharacterized protein [Periplaneta americana]|uniref:uncharacterized protein n=1 Tax=Periplaneta americana TaxID=6978 RepID=UPI0037E70D6C
MSRRFGVPTLAALVCVLAISLVESQDEKETEKCKRQIFREQVLPHSGGKIPDDAFRADRLALNRLNKDGISVPDGIVLDARRRDKHPTLRHNSDLEMSVIKVVLTPEGRYVAPEGRYHYPNPITVDSTYIIRPPIGNYKHELRQRPTLSRRPIPAPLELPNKHEQANSNLPLYLGIQDNNAGYIFQSHHGLFSDHFYPFYTPQTLSTDLDAFFEHFSDHGRLIRHSPAHIYHSEGSKIPGVEGKDYPSYSHIPETGFTCNEHRQKDKMYADPRARCQVFHFCQKDGRRDSFLCPKGTVFNQALSHCDWWYNVKCG